jgi:nucleotide-binding universal stress UspA family protein
MFPNRRILCPTDFSPSATTAFGLACVLARDHQAAVTVLHVTRPVVSFGDVIASRKEGFRDDLREQLRRIRPADPAVMATHLILSGEPDDVIVDTVETHKFDLIVMGTHGRSGLGRLVLGSVAEAVIRTAPCPVLTVRDRAWNQTESLG